MAERQIDQALWMDSDGRLSYTDGTSETWAGTPKLRSDYGKKWLTLIFGPGVDVEHVWTTISKQIGDLLMESG